jgi:hypothetical protein
MAYSDRRWGQYQKAGYEAEAHIISSMFKGMEQPASPRFLEVVLRHKEENAGWSRGEGHQVGEGDKDLKEMNSVTDDGVSLPLPLTLPLVQ